MKKITLDDLATMQPVKLLVIRSLDLALYQPAVVIDGKELPLRESNGTVMVSRNLGSLRKRLAKFSIEKLVLRHTSAYDEMIGQPQSEGNTLEVPLDAQPYALPTWLQ